MLEGTILVEPPAAMKTGSQFHDQRYNSTSIIYTAFARMLRLFSAELARLRIDIETAKIRVRNYSWKLHQIPVVLEYMRYSVFSCYAFDCGIWMGMTHCHDSIAKNRLGDTYISVLQSRQIRPILRSIRGIGLQQGSEEQMDNRTYSTPVPNIHNRKIVVLDVCGLNVPSSFEWLVASTAWQLRHNTCLLSIRNTSLTRNIFGSVRAMEGQFT